MVDKIEKQKLYWENLKKIFNVEKKISKYARKSIVATKDIYPGEFLIKIYQLKDLVLVSVQ